MAPRSRKSAAPPPVEKARDPSTDNAPLLAELGATGLKRTGGVLLEEFLTTLSGTRAVKVYREMSENDPLIGGALLAIETLARQAPTSSEPASDLPEAHREAEFLDECRDDMEHTWSEMFSEILTCIVFGWSYFEPVYKLRRGFNEAPQMNSRYDDGRWAWRKIAPRAQESLYEWDFDENTGDIRGMWQQTPPLYSLKYVPLDRALLFRVRSRKGSPEGKSLLRPVYRPWFFCKRIEEYEAIGVQRDLAGLAKMEIPFECMQPGAAAPLASIRTHYEQMVPRISRGEYEGLVLPHEEKPNGDKTGYRFTLVQSGGRRPIDVNEIIKRLDSRKLIALLAEFLVLGMDKVGSFSLSSDKTDMFALAIRAILDMIEEVFNRVAVPRLMQLNRVPVDLWPRIKFGDIEKRSITETATYISTLTAAGHLAPHDKLDAHLLEIADLPAREDAASLPADDARLEAQVQTLLDEQAREIDPVVAFGGAQSPTENA